MGVFQDRRNRQPGRMQDARMEFNLSPAYNKASYTLYPPIKWINSEVPWECVRKIEASFIDSTTALT